MFVPFTRIVAILMAGVLCFVLLLPLALRAHNTALAVFVIVVFVAYVGANAYLWKRLSRR
ncbi:MAG TPA: hypothetical protein VIK27_00805 [Candidatus Aquilonibacter sp.]